jgi:phage tail sheath gpL-like
MLNEVLKLANRAVEALEKMAENSTKIVEAQEKSIKFAKGLMKLGDKYMDTLPEEYKDDEEYKALKNVIVEANELVEQL